MKPECYVTTGIVCAVCLSRHSFCNEAGVCDRATAQNKSSWHLNINDDAKLLHMRRGMLFGRSRGVLQR